MLRAREKVTDVIQVLGQKLHPDDFLHPAQLGRRIYYKMFGGTHLVNRAGWRAPSRIYVYSARCR